MFEAFYLINKLTNKIDFKKAFERSERYKTKIFLDKKGPVFDYKKYDFSNKNNSAHSEMKKETLTKAGLKAMKEEEIRKIKIKEMNQNNKLGFSFGYKEGFELNLLQQRKDKNKEIKQEFQKIFNLENILTSVDYYKKPYNRSSSDESVREKVKRKKQAKQMLLISKNKTKFENVQIR